MTAAVIVIAIAGVAMLLGLALRTNRRFAGFEQLPIHFDLRGRADAFGPARVILWVIPGILIGTLVLVAALMIIVPREAQNGNPVVGMLVCVAALIAAQVLIGWLLERWATDQERS